MKFDKHPSMKIVELFKRKPFQGQIPERAKIVFLSSDANYSPEISNHQFFEFILEYQNDSIAFWKKYGYHPFLLPNYPFNKNQGGVPFHRNFSKIGLTSQHAELISFLELLDIPTIGNKSENPKAFFELLTPAHLKRIDKLITDSSNKLFFIPGGVLKDMLTIKKRGSLFQWLDYNSRSTTKYSKTINGNKIKEIYHFSSTQIHGQIPEISKEIELWLQKEK